MLVELNFFISLQNEKEFLVQWSFEITESNILVKNLATLQLHAPMDETIGRSVSLSDSDFNLCVLGLPHKLAECDICFHTFPY